MPTLDERLGTDLDVDQALRVECLRLSVGSVTGGGPTVRWNTESIVDAAKAFERYIKGSGPK
jgi:hypothetical protein